MGKTSKNIAIQELFRAHEVVQFPFRRFTPSTVGSSHHHHCSNTRIPGLVAKSALGRWNNHRTRCRGTWQKIPNLLHTSWKINGWNLKITHEKKGKWSEPNLYDYVPCLIFRGVTNKGWGNSFEWNLAIFWTSLALHCQFCDSNICTKKTWFLIFNHVKTCPTWTNRTGH